MKRYVTVLNTAHFPITVTNEDYAVDEKISYVFLPYREVIIEIETTSSLFYLLRTNKELRVGKQDNQSWLMRKSEETKYLYNFIYDSSNQHKKNNYQKAIEALSNPIIKHLPGKTAGYMIKPSYNLNVRYFSSKRINEQGKSKVGPYDVFYSHGIGDKNYWIGNNIADFKYAMVPGPAWEKRMLETGYEGKIYVVGYTKLDPLFNGDYVQNKYKKPYIVWAPTHGYVNKNKGRSSYPQCLEYIDMISEDYIKTIALHPTSRIKQQGEKDVTMQELLDADVVIADAGSTVYEAWALGKPVIFPDWICKDDVLNHFRNDTNNFEYKIYKEGIGYHAKDINHLNRLIKKALRDGMQSEEIEFMEQIFPMRLRGKAGEQAAKALQEIYQENF